MNKRGFTITELLAVVVILGILTGLTSIGVTKYRQNVKEKELINLHATIETGFDNYRSKLILSGDFSPSELSLCDSNNQLRFDITYNGNKLKCDSGGNNVKIKEATVYTKIKGEILKNSGLNSKYLNDKQPTNEEEKKEMYIKDGVCMVKSNRKEDPTTGDYILVKECEMNGSNYVPSKEEIICIKLETEEEILIDDFNDKNSMCRYWSE